MLPQQIQLQVRQDSICQISAASIKNGINGRIQKGICEIGCPCSCRCRTSRLGLPYRGKIRMEREAASNWRQTQEIAGLGWARPSEHPTRAMVRIGRCNIKVSFGKKTRIPGGGIRVLYGLCGFGFCSNDAFFHDMCQLFGCFQWKCGKKQHGLCLCFFRRKL